MIKNKAVFLCIHIILTENDAKSHSFIHEWMNVMNDAKGQQEVKMLCLIAQCLFLLYGDMLYKHIFY